MDSIGLEVFLIVCLILLNGFLSMSEMAIVSSNRIRLQALSQSGNRGARIALGLIDSPSNLLASVQIGITLVGVLIGAFGGSSLALKVGVQLTAGIPRLQAHSEGIGLTVVVVVSTYLSLILGELVPKRLALAAPEKTAAKVAPAVKVIATIATPGVKVLAWTTDFFMRILRKTRTHESPQITEEEVKLMVEQGAEAGVFEASEETIIKRALRLGSLSAGDIMTPRTKTESFDISEAKNDEVLARVKTSKHSYFPVYDEDLDNVVGVLSAKKILYRLAQGHTWTIDDCMLDPLLIPESVPVIGLLDTLRNQGAHMAIVIDEYGGMAGIVTIIDLMEAIMGSMPHESERSSHRYTKREDGSILVDGMTAIHEFEEYFDVNFKALTEEDDIQTIAGLLMHQMGRIPREGDVLQLDNLRIEVVDMDARRVDKILVQSVGLGHDLPS